MGGNSYHMANLLPTCLKGNARKWLRNKVFGSIKSWGDFTRALIQACQGRRILTEVKKVRRFQHWG